MPEITLNPPSRRECLECGRVDVWDQERGEWRIEEVNSEKRAGERFCLHEWDITGTHTPILE